MSRRLEARLGRAAAVGLLVLALVVAALGLERRTTWYLASDQFAFLMFASDLMQGRALHPPDDLELLASTPENAPRDAFFRTYFWIGDKVYSRYPPGFPALLALAGLLGGEPAQHVVNPILFLSLLVAVAAVAWFALRGHDRSFAAGVAVASVWLVLLLPTQLHLWGTTVARDLLAHLLGLVAVVAALYASPAIAGLALGLAATVRPDAALYGASLAAVLWVQSARLRSWVLVGLGFAVGIVPLLAYNHAARGSIFGLTQAGEFDAVLSSLRGSPFLVLAQSLAVPSGGAFRLAHLRTTLPANLALLEHAFSWSLALGGVGLLWSLRVRPVLAAAVVPYAVLALPFYSCWPHADARYLAGVAISVVVLVGTGAVVPCLGLTRDASTRLRIAVAGGAVAVAGLALARPRSGSLGGAPEMAAAVAALVAVGLSFSRRGVVGRAAVLAPGLALAVVGLLRVAGSEGRRDLFQRPEVEVARRTLEAAVPPGALVLVGDGLGRPAENIAHYTHADAHYLSELPLLGSTAAQAAARHALAGRRTFLLVDGRAGAGGRIEGLEPGATRSLRERRMGTDLYAWFVDARSAPAGAELYEIEPTAFALEWTRALVGNARRDKGAGSEP